jgi:tellurite resistance protein TerC
MLITRHDNIEPERNILMRLAQLMYPVTKGFRGPKFFCKENGKTAITPLFLVLLIIESTDALFAIDSIPAIFAVTTDPFIVFTSNVFAILGLRSLYFALAAMMDKFQYLKMSLVFVLAYVGIKMILSHSYHIPTLFSLLIIGTILFVGICSSVVASKRDTAKLKSPL